MSLSDEQIFQIKKIYENLSRKDFKNKKFLILNFTKYDVDGDWLERIEASRKFGRNCMTEEVYKIRYGDRWEEILNSQTNKRKNNKEIIIKKHGIEYYENLIKQKNWHNLQNLSERIGEDAAKEKHSSYLEKWKSSIEKRKLDRKWDNGLSHESLFIKHGKEEALIRWNKKSEKQKYAFSLEKFVKDFGETLGKEKWDQYKDKMRTLSEKAASNRDSVGFSKISQKLFWDVVQRLDLKKEMTFFKECNGEKIIKIYKDGKYIKFYSLDFLYENKIIEFDGNYWHKNNEDKDKERDEILTKRGFSTLRINDKNYKKDPYGTIDKIVEFLNG